MSNLGSAFVILYLTIFFSCNAATDSTLSSQEVIPGHVELDSTDSRIISSEAKTAGLAALQKTVKFIHANFRLKKIIRVSLEDCNGRSDHYRAQTNSILLCYERLREFVGVAQQRPSTSSSDLSVFQSTVSFYFLHEISHALINNFTLDHVGKEEDAADQLAAMLLTEQNNANSPIEASYQFIKAFQSGVYDSDYSGPHSVTPQRYFNLLCWAHGISKGSLATDELQVNLPAARRQSCLIETERNRLSWIKKLSPYMKSRNFVEPIQGSYLAQNNADQSQE